MDEVELVLPVPSSTKTATLIAWSTELPKGLSIRLSKELSKGLSKGLSETAANILKMIYSDNYISRDVLAERVGISVTSVQNHINKLKSIGLLKRIGSTKHGHWEVVE